MDRTGKLKQTPKRAAHDKLLKSQKPTFPKSKSFKSLSKRIEDPLVPLTALIDIPFGDTDVLFTTCPTYSLQTPYWVATTVIQGAHYLLDTEAGENFI